MIRLLKAYSLSVIRLCLFLFSYTGFIFLYRLYCITISPMFIAYTL